MGNTNHKKEDELNAIKSNIKYFNIQGKKKKMDLTNQDVFDVIEDLGENIKYFAVYDGHGPKGREAALGLKKEISKKLISDKKKIASFKDIYRVEQYFKDVYKNIQKKLAKNSNDFDVSGTCSVSVLMINTKMYTINLGDSRCVLGIKKSSGEHKKDSEKIAVEMSIDHKPIRDDEQKRIVEKGGEISDVKIPGAYRVFRKNDDIPGLAVSRSIGDTVAHEVGVSCEPEVFEKNLNNNDHFIAIASDGVWDSMSSTEVVGYIFEKIEQFGEENDKINIAQLLTEECRKRWEILNLFKQKFIQNIERDKDESKKKDKDQHNVQDIDDITCIINFINVDKEEF